MMRRMGFGSAGEMIFLFVLALVVLGPKKLPELARQLGKFMNEFKRASNEFKYQIESEINNLELQEKRAKQQILPPSLATSESQPPIPPQGTIASGSMPEADPNPPSHEVRSEANSSESASSEVVSSSSIPETVPTKGSDA